MAVTAAVLLLASACGGEATTTVVTTSTTVPATTTSVIVAPPAPVATAEDVIDLIAEALADLDPDDFSDIEHSAATDVVRPEIMGWQIEHLRFDPSFTDCGEVEAGTVRCAVSYGDDYFYSAVLGYPVTGSITVEVSDEGRFRVTEWPFPEDLKSAERELRTWIQATHPESEADMFGNDAYGVFKFTDTALRLHAEYLDEYLAHLAS